MKRNLERMLHLVEETFALQGDPSQLSVDDEVRARLLALHPATLGECADADGPLAWTLAFPTTRDLMEAFLDGQIDERGLFEATCPGQSFETVYLCSALVLPEHRRRGLARELLGASLRAMRREHPIRWLFCWALTPEGARLAEAVARDASLPLRIKA